MLGTATDFQVEVQKYQKVRARSIALAAPLTIEDYIPQPALFASPPKWHLAHITWFFEEFLLKVHLNGYRPFDPEFSFLFNSYYNTVGERTARGDRGTITRPGVKKVMDYRNYVDKHMVQLLNEKGEKPGIQEVLEIGLNHEEQHQELFLTDLKYAFSLNPTDPIYDARANLLADRNQVSGWVGVKEGIYEIGHQRDGFCYDNELGVHKVYLQDVQLSKQLVTNGEYLEFIQAGGYQDFSLWLDEGWTWVQENEIVAPLYWKKKKGAWTQFTLAGRKELDPHAILGHVSFYEAEAYARWKGMRLPTEFEWEVAAPDLDWGKRWEWTHSAYLPYPRFKTAEGALGEYNGKFMVNQMVLRGASVATAPGHSRISYRNFFHPNYQWQYSGIRLAK